MKMFLFDKLKQKISSRMVLWGSVGIVLVAALVLILVFRANIFHFTTTDSVSFDATAELSAAHEKLDAGVGQATVLEKTDSRPYKVNLSFEGLRQKSTMDYIVQLLKENDIEAEFFVSAKNAAEESDVLTGIIESGYPIGNYGLDSEAYLDQLDRDTLLSTFVKSQKILSVLCGTQPTSFIGYRTAYTDDVLRCAAAAGLTTAVDNTYSVDIWSFSSYSSVLRFVNEKPFGSFVSFRILDPLAIQEDAALPNASPAIDKQETVQPDADKVDMSAMSYDESVMLIAGWLIRAVKEATFLSESVDLCEKNAGALADVPEQIHTIAPNVCYLFSNLGNDAELDALLAQLQALDAPSTFFVTYDDLTEHADEIRRIVAAGHALGVAVQPSSEEDVYTVCSEILLCQKHLASDFGYEGATLVLQPRETISDLVREAVSAAGASLIVYQTRVVRDSEAAFTDPQQVVDNVLGTRTVSLMRGHCVYFAMNLYQDPTLLAGVVSVIQSEKSVYQPETLYALLNDTDNLYTYPVPAANLIEGLSTAIAPGHITSDEQFYDMAYNRYIGTPYINNWRLLPGFTVAEIANINKDGRVYSSLNDGRVAYLTFDDWGSDAAITKLLEVLDKYDVKATFFIRTNNIDSNPNLLRAIAAAGHDICSHTNEHYLLSAPTDQTNLYQALSEEQLNELQQDVLTSWNKLVSIAGDVSFDGKPVVKKLFRSPTLAISKGGMQVVFDLGFDYIVSGSYSSRDYQASSARSLYTLLQSNLQKGAILVMHMSDTADSTAQALDMLLANNSRLPENRRYAFIRLSESLDGTYTNANKGSNQ